MPCDGQVQQLDLHIYNPGTLTLAFFKFDNKRLPVYRGYVSITFKTTGRKTLNTSYHVTRDIIITIIKHKNVNSVLRDHSYDSMVEGSLVKESKHIYMENEEIVVKNTDLVSSNERKIPSLQLLIYTNDSKINLVHMKPLIFV